MTSPFVPREYQRLAIDFLLDRNRAALLAKPGMGKSSITLAVLDILHLTGETHPALVLAPKRVAKHTWTREAQKWADFQHLEVVPIIGTEQERLAATRRDVPIYTANYEQIPWLIDHFGAKWPFRTLILDESTKVKNTRVSVRTSSKGRNYLQRSGGSKRAGLLAEKVAFKHVKRLYELTGSPAANGMADLWGQMFFLDAGRRLGRSYTAFEDRWFERVLKHKNDEYGELRLKPGAEAEINERIADLCLALDPRDWFPELQEPLRITLPVYLPPKARALYEKMEREMFVEIGKHGVEAFNAGSMMMKCRQIASGFLLEQDAQGQSTSAFHDLHDEKLQALESIYEESGGTPLLVAYWFKPDLARLKQAFPDGVDLATDAGLAAFLAGKAPMGFAHPQSVGHGLDGLQDVTNIIVFYSADWNLEYREQVIERVGPTRQLQSGHDRKVLIYDIVAEDTIDETIAARVSSKCSVQEAVFDRMKRKSLA